FPVSEQEVEYHRRRKFGSSAKPAVAGVVMLSKRSIGDLQHLRRQRSAARRRRREVALVDLPQLLGALYDAVPPLGVRIAYRLQNFAERRNAVTIVGRKISSAIKWTAIGQQKHRHRPAARTAHR